MCGIVAGVAGRDIVPVLLEGLKRLEYRGYDSCGVAVYADGLNLLDTDYQEIRGVAMPGRSVRFGLRVR